MRRIAHCLGVLGVGLALNGSAEMYRWTDGSGTVHFTQDIAEVPPAQRDAARRSSGADGRRRIQSYAPPASADSAPAELRMPDLGTASKPVYRIRVTPGANSMRVNVRLNDRVVAPFLIDTGASDVVIPQSVARRLGIQAGAETLTARYATANGIVESPVVLLDSVELEGARATDVRASISSSMPIGLLGLSFFNRFTYRIDAAAGIVTLSPNEGGGPGKTVRGGRTEVQWRNEFRTLRQRIDLVDQRYDELDPLRERHAKHLIRARDQFRQELAFLEQQADRARVPDAWRY